MKSILILISTFWCISADALVLDFDDPSIPDPGEASSFVTDGFLFDITPDPAPAPPHYIPAPGSGMGFCPGCVITLSQVGGGAFTVNGFGAQNFPTDYQLSVTALLDGGGSQNEIFDVNGYLDFDLGWENVTSLTFTNLQNEVSIITYVEVNAVPVPAAVWLFASGLGLLGWMRKRACLFKAD